MVGSQYIHSNSETNDDKESSSDFEDSDDQEGKKDIALVRIEPPIFVNSAPLIIIIKTIFLL